MGALDFLYNIWFHGVFYFLSPTYPKLQQLKTPRTDRTVYQHGSTERKSCRKISDGQGQTTKPKPQSTRLGTVRFYPTPRYEVTAQMQIYPFAAPLKTFCASTTIAEGRMGTAILLSPSPLPRMPRTALQNSLKQLLRP